MEVRHISDEAQKTIQKYRNFVVENTSISVPYFNNKHARARAKLAAQIGKGSPEAIHDEVETLALAEKINLKSIDAGSLKHFMVDHNIGIDCSGFVYQVLKPKHVSFPLSKGLIGMIRTAIRPAENAGVTTFAHPKNSREIGVKEALPGDIITMVGGPDNGKGIEQRDHILLVHRVDYRDSLPSIIHYIHAIAWPTDGEYGHGVREGVIFVENPERPIIEQSWKEEEKTGQENYTFSRAEKSTTTLRRPLFL